MQRYLCIMGNMRKKIIIDEGMEREIISEILTESFYPDREKVLIVKEFLDANFSPVPMDDIDANGYPTKDKMVNMLSKERQPLKTMTVGELLLMLDDKFHPMVNDDSDRRKFLKQIIKEWYTGKLGKNGVLSVNFI